MTFTPELIWFLIGVTLLILELTTFSFVLIFFGLGAILVSVVLLLTSLSFNIQLILFILFSILLLLFLRKWVKTLFQNTFSKDPETLEEDFAGRKALVVEDINPPEAGKVELHGTYWNAEADVAIAKGSTVKIIRKDNLTLRVTPYPNPKEINPL